MSLDEGHRVRARHGHRCFLILQSRSNRMLSKMSQMQLKQIPNSLLVGEEGLKWCYVMSVNTESGFFQKSLV